jgi:Family of unknown function (DUF6364)
MKQNLTVQLEADTIKKARIVAARRSTSISRLVASEIDRLVREDEAYERARDEALGELERGYDLGSEGRLARRDELYDR